MTEVLIQPASEAVAIFGEQARFTDVAFAEQFPGLPSLAIRRILLPFDFSRSSVCALRAVASFAEKQNATIHLLHAVNPPGGSPEGNPGGADDRLAEASERLLKHWVKRVVGGRVRTFVSIRVGTEVDVIAARAIATRTDLIVMTSRSCTAGNNELRRSAAERVSRIAPCPVLTIPEKCAGQTAYAGNGFADIAPGVVVMPVDFSTAAEHALRYAAAITARNHGKLILAHGTESEELEGQSVHHRIHAWAERILHGAFPFETATWPGGHSLYAILSEAVRDEAGLIVLPTRVQSWARRLRAGSITDGVLRQAPCPVLSINENAFGSAE